MDVVTLAAAKAATRKSSTPIPSPTAPTSPAALQEWDSYALTDLIVSPSYSDRAVILAPLAGEGAAVQEVAVWTDSTRYNALYTGGNGLCVRYCLLTADPLVAANWSKYTGPGTTGQVIGNGAGSVAGLVNHANVYVEGSTVYVFGNDPTANAVKAWTIPLNDATYTATLAGTTIPTASLPSGGTIWGNTCVAKDGSTYYNLQEYRDASGQWQSAWYSCATVTGTYTATGAATPLTSLYPDSTNYPTASGAWLAKQGGVWVCYYHCQNLWNGLSEVFRATAPSLGANNFTPLDLDDRGRARPVVQRVGTYEVQQVCDVALLQHPSGLVYCFWTGMDNRDSIARVYGTLMHPRRRIWNGNVWQPLETRPDRRSIDTTRHVVVALSSDFTTGTSTSFADVTGATTTWQPSGRDLGSRFVAVISADTAGSYQFQFSCSGTTVTMAAVTLAANTPTAVSFVARVDQKTPGTALSCKWQYKVPSGATLTVKANSTIEVFDTAPSGRVE